MRVWDKFKEGLGKRIGDGSKTSFWFDTRLPLKEPLIHHVNGNLSSIDFNASVNDLVSPSISWDTVKLSRWLPSNILNYFEVLFPPVKVRINLYSSPLQMAISP